MTRISQKQRNCIVMNIFCGFETKLLKNSFVEDQKLNEAKTYRPLHCESEIQVLNLTSKQALPDVNLLVFLL